jgi:DNA-binding NtrC family response regulator
MKRALITWVDKGPSAVPDHHSPRKPNDQGPVLRLLHDEASRGLYESVWLLCTPANESAGQKLAVEVRKFVGRVEVLVLDLDDPSDHQKIFVALGPALETINQQVPAKVHPRDVVLSAGTPQCQTIWVVLVQAGLFDARMLQVIPPAFVPHPHPRAIKEVRFAFDGFPEIRAMREEIERLSATYEPRGEGSWGASEVMIALHRRILRLAPTTLPILILGETGVGKERVARALHDHSARRNRVFIAENCAAFAEGLLASELFGAERGAFTGANARRRGLFEQANGGTLFLDEIGEMDPRAQAMLLRVLQEGSLRRVGGEESVAVDVRVIAATHQPLMNLVTQGRFRQDLFYRLHGAQVQVPPLRERSEDIAFLIDVFLRHHGKQGELRVSARAMTVLEHYAWPGNVRELESEVRRWTVFCRRRVDVDDLSPEIAGATATGKKSEGPSEPASLASVVEMAERAAIQRVLTAENGNLLRSARLLDIDRNTLKRKIARFGLNIRTKP